jgi:lactate permease
MLTFLRFWKPRTIYRFPADAARREGEAAKHSRRVIVRAWLPFLILTCFVLLWGLPGVKAAMNRWTTPSAVVRLPDGSVRPGPAGWDVPLLHNRVLRDRPVVDKPTAEAARYDFNWLTATGTAVFLAALLSAVLLGLSPSKTLSIFGQTIYRMRFAVLAIVSMLGTWLCHSVFRDGCRPWPGVHSNRLGLFPFFGTFLGWLGVALTGSDTSSNALFGSLQRITAEQLGLSPVLMASANSAGGVMGKMVDAQSIVVATAATNQVGNEGKILRSVAWHSVALAAIVGIIVMLFAYVFPSAIPK